MCVFPFDLEDEASGRRDTLDFRAYPFRELTRLGSERRDPLKLEVTDDIRAAKRRFHDECAALRPALYRFCTRMTGSPCDGEDVLQETLAHAFYRLPELNDEASLRAWLFRIAHNRCIDFLRGRKRFDELDEEAGSDGGAAMDEELDRKRRAARALSRIVTELPPKERACVLLKDVVDCSIEETAEITGSNVGAVKIALHRGRAKLEEMEGKPLAARRPMEAEQRALVERYLSAFNRRDWNAVRAMLAADAHLEVVERAQGPMRDSCYFVNHESIGQPWKVELAWVDGVEEIVHYRHVDGRWRPHSIVRVSLRDGKIATIRDFLHVDAMLDDCDVTEVRA